MKQRIKIIAYESLSHDNITCNLHELVQLYKTQLNKIPEKYQRDAVIEIEPGNSWGDTNIHTFISYWRDESDEEYKKRIADEERRKNRAEIEEKQTYERLKRKFEEGKS